MFSALQRQQKLMRAKPSLLSLDNAFLDPLLIVFTLLTIALGVKISSPGPVLFVQRRYGLGYLRNWSLKLDQAIIAKTVLVVANDEQAY
jgi:lipopolysaccharide/colanic/teichoic acid biosynthesis glycosyltransferase